jgi:protein-tyrosine phosphatase
MGWNFLAASTKGLSHRKLNTFHGALSLQTASGDGALADTEEPASSHQSPSGTSRKTSSTTTSRRQVSDVKQLQPANPFFDNIRQNLELSHGGITERIPLNLPDNVVRRSKELPKFLRELVEKPDEQVAEQIANEFESVERGEQRRLQGIMNWHSKGSRKLAGWKNQAEEDEEDEVMWTANAGSRQAAINRIVALRRKSEHAHESNGKKDAAHAVESPGSEASGEGEEYFPFSITAGIERGSKNRLVSPNVIGCARAFT